MVETCCDTTESESLIQILYRLSQAECGNKGERIPSPLHGRDSSQAPRRSIYHRTVRRKVNLEVTGEEKPKTCLRRTKANKRLCHEKKPVCALPDEEKPVSLVSDEKKPVCAVPGRKITTNGILRIKTLIKIISEITRGTNYI